MHLVQAGQLRALDDGPLRAGLAEVRGPGAVARGDGAVSFWPSMVTTGARAASSGQAPESMASVKAVTLAVDDVDGGIARQISASTRARSQCLCERVDRHPVGLVVVQREGGEADLARERVAAACGDLIDLPGELDFGFGMELVRRLRAFQAGERMPSSAMARSIMSPACFCGSISP